MPALAIGLGVGSLLAGMYSANKTASNNTATNNTNWYRQQLMNERNYQAQKEFYQNSIQWRKQDALKAGINPIYALGASSASFSPSFQASLDTAIKDPTADNINNAISTGISAYQATQQAKESKAQIALMKSQQLTQEAQTRFLDARTSELLSSVAERAGQPATPAPAPAPAPAKQASNMINKGNKAKTTTEILNNVLDPRKHAIVYQNGDGSFSVTYDDQSIRGQVFSENQPGLVASAIPFGNEFTDKWQMNKMSWELKDEFELIAKELEKLNPGKKAFINQFTKNGIWKVYLKDDEKTMKNNLKNRLREKGASEKYINSIK